MPDHEGSLAIAQSTLKPTLTGVAELLAAHGASPEVVEEVLSAVAVAYADGHRDGSRHAVAEIAPVAARYGLDLRLDAMLEAPAWTP